MSILTFLARVHLHLQPLICVRADGGSCDNFLHRAVSWGSCVSRFTNLIRKRFRQKLFSQGRVNIRFLPGFDLVSICPYQVTTCQVSVFLLILLSMDSVVRKNNTDCSTLPITDQTMFWLCCVLFCMRRCAPRTFLV